MFQLREIQSHELREIRSDEALGAQIDTLLPHAPTQIWMWSTKTNHSADDI